MKRRTDYADVTCAYISIVIVLFAAFISMAQGGAVMEFADISVLIVQDYEKKINNSKNAVTGRKKVIS